VSTRPTREIASFLVARNPQQDSRLPYLVRLPLEGGLVLKARAAWPVTARVYCHRFEEPWPEDADIVDEARVVVCRRRGAAVDLVVDRPRQARSQFVFTEVKGREAAPRSPPATTPSTHDGRLLAAVERKSLDNLAATLSDGTLAFQLQRLAELPLAAIVVEARYSALFKLEHVNGSWLADQLTRLQVRYPTSPSSSPTTPPRRRLGPTASSPPR
jgi:hypothetical protein